MPCDRNRRIAKLPNADLPKSNPTVVRLRLYRHGVVRPVELNGGGFDGGRRGNTHRNRNTSSRQQRHCPKVIIGDGTGRDVHRHCRCSVGLNGTDDTEPSPFIWGEGDPITVFGDGENIVKVIEETRQGGQIPLPVETPKENER